ncbi:MAG: diphthine synthase [Candidatus Thermoplasmatota archaeon]|nr:diphthine synthase [Candidatus Thermoplasmatota archaeon]
MGRLTMIGLGISDERGISIEGLERLKGADAAFAEFFTSILTEGSMERLEALCGRRIEMLDRKCVEDEDRILSSLREHEDVCFLTAGDPLAATTHQEIRLRSLKAGHRVDVIHSASIYTAAAGAAGLQHYKFGRTTTIPFPEGDYLPTSPLEIILENRERGLHTLCLLDIQADRGRYMTVHDACSVLIQMAGKLGTEKIDPTTMVVGIARAGRNDAKVAFASLSALLSEDMGDPPHCLIVPGRLHFMEEEMLDLFRIGRSG